MTADPPVLLLGGTVNALCVARSLARSGIGVHAYSDGMSPSLARHSRYVTTFTGVHQAATAQQEWLQALPSGPPGAVLLPCGDPGIEFIAHHREYLEDLGYAPIEANDEVALSLLDKARTYALADKTGIEVPRTKPVSSTDDIEEWVSSSVFPCALKPLHSHTSVHRIGAKVIVVHHPDELRAQAARLIELGIEALITEIVPGKESAFCSYYAYLDADSDPLAQFTKRKPRQYPAHFGWGCYHETAWEPEAAELGLRFLQGVGARGMNVVEFKRDARDGRLKLIECNPRMTATIELVRLDGADFPLLAYERAAGRPERRFVAEPTGRREWSPVADSRAFLVLRREGELSTLEWVTTLRPPLHLPIFDRLDPAPSVVNGWRRVRRGVEIAGRRVRPARDAAAARPHVFGGGRSSMVGRPAPATRLVAALSAKGRLGAELGWRLDIARSTKSMAATGFWHLGTEVDLADEWNAFHRRIWQEAADAVAGELQELGSGFLELSRGGRRTFVWQSRVMLDDPVTLRMALDKSLGHRRFRDAGLPVAEHLEFSAGDLRPALDFLGAAPGACVVKPAAGTAGGHGVTCGILCADDLIRACVRARRNGRLLIERQVAGDEYRLLFLDGELLDVLHRRPPVLMGDGCSTVSALIDQENRRRSRSHGQAGLRLLDVDLDCVLSLRAAGLSLRSIPPAGAPVRVKSTANANAPGDNSTLTEVARTLRDDAALAASLIGVRLAAVEVITPDPSCSLRRAGGVVVEVNGTPGLQYHYLVADPAHATPVAIPVLERLLTDDASSRPSPCRTVTERPG